MSANYNVMTCDNILMGIESSCDETSVALVRNGREILSNVIVSQIKEHQRFGGVVPEVASRKHIENICLVTDAALKEAGLGLESINAVAVTNRPGLIGALLVGLSFAKGLAYGLEVPLIAVNHLHGHIYANFLEHEVRFPLVCLVVSGGHTAIIYMRDHRDFEIMGETRDDAAGEAFDKVARFVGLGYPGGPAVQKAAAQGQPGRYVLPRVFLDREDYEFSFSGLKTATMNIFHRARQRGQDINVPDLAAEFQEALVEVLVEKTVHAALDRKVGTILMAGGVAANARLREMMTERAQARGIEVLYPSLKLCTDNGAMIAAAAYPSYLEGEFSPLCVNAYATSRSFALQG